MGQRCEQQLGRPVRERIDVEVRGWPGSDAREDDERVDRIRRDAERGRAEARGDQAAVTPEEPIGGYDQPDQREFEADVFPQPGQQQRQPGDPAPRAALDREPPAERKRRQEPEVAELAEPHRDQRRVDERHGADPVGDTALEPARPGDRRQQRRARDGRGG